MQMEKLVLGEEVHNYKIITNNIDKVQMYQQSLEIRDGTGMNGNVKKQKQNKTKQRKPQNEQNKVTESRPHVSLTSKLPLKRKRLSKKMRKDKSGKHRYKIVRNTGRQQNITIVLADTFTQHSH